MAKNISMPVLRRLQNLTLVFSKTDCHVPKKRAIYLPNRCLNILDCCNFSKCILLFNLKCMIIVYNIRFFEWNNNSFLNIITRYVQGTLYDV